MNNPSVDFKERLTEHLRELHLPTIRRCFEDKARHAERETLSYERYLHELAELECQERRENRIAQLHGACYRACTACRDGAHDSTDDP